MRRILLAAFFLAASLFAVSPAQAFHHGFGGHGFGGHGFHGGFGHGFGGWGHRGFGYGGYGGYGYRGIGYGGYRGFYPGWGYRRVGFGYPYYGGYGGFGYGLGLGIGYGGYGYGYPYYGGYGYGYPYYGGYGGFGYGGYGSPYYGGYGSYGGGYGYPAYNVGYSPWYGCYNGGTTTNGTTVGLGYPASGPSIGTYVPSGSLIVSASPVVSSVVIGGPATTTARPVAAPPRFIAPNAAPTPALVQSFLGLKEIHPIAIGTSAPPTLVAKMTAPAKGIGLGRISNMETRTKADRMLQEGDDLFRAQNFHSALQRYKLAASTAPDLAEAFWRQGHALVATRNYDLATTAFKRAIALTDDLGRGGFRLSDIYGGAAMTKADHLESLAEWATKRGNSPDPYFLVGIFLNYDGQAARADKFFQKAADLAGFGGGHIAVFLEPAAEASPKLIERVVRPASSPVIVPVSAGTEV